MATIRDLIKGTSNKILDTELSEISSFFDKLKPIFIGVIILLLLIAGNSFYQKQKKEFYCRDQQIPMELCDRFIERRYK